MAHSVFQGNHKLIKNPEWKKYMCNTVNSEHALFFRASASCSRILNGEYIFHTAYTVHIHLGVIPCYLGWCIVQQAHKKLGTPGGRKVFQSGPKFLNYAQ